MTRKRSISKAAAKRLAKDVDRYLLEHDLTQVELAKQLGYDGRSMVIKLLNAHPVERRTEVRIRKLLGLVKK